MRALQITSCAVVLASCLATGVRAQDSNESRRLTYLTFSGPVEVPGMTLAAGTYRFQLASTQTSLHAVQILSRDGKKVFTTFLTIPDSRPSAPRETAVMFAEAAPGAPQAIREWFYAGNPTGEQFTYPRRQALAIAKANHTTVLSRDDNQKSGKIESIDENGNSVKEESRIAAADANAGPAQAINAAPAQGQAAPAPRTLPRTASPLALIELLSAFCLVGAFALGQVRRRA